MLFEPQIPELQRHIDHYWIVSDISQLSYGNSHMYAYPGITPDMLIVLDAYYTCLLYTSPSPRDQRGSRMPSSA